MSTMAQQSLPIARGLRGRCPRCGEGRLFQGFLNLRRAASVAVSTMAFADAGDGPAVFVILLGGAVVVFAALMTEIVYQPPYLGACGVVVAVDPDRHAVAAAGDQGLADCLAVSS